MLQSEFEIPDETENPLGGAPTEAGADRVERLLAGLNPPQRKAAEHVEGPLLVVAGAGSGKTTTLAARMARLVRDGADPGRILLLTFSRRAAAEMRQRAARLLHRALGLAATAQVPHLAWAGVGFQILVREEDAAAARDILDLPARPSL